MAILGFLLLATNATWNLNAAGNWNVNGNWTPATFPNAIGDTANFGPVINANRTVTLGANITVGTVTFDDNNNYTIAGGGANSLTFQVSAGNASLAITSANGAGTHTINNTVTAVNLSSALTLSHNSTSGFSIAAPIARGTNTLTVSTANTGTVTLSAAMSGNGSLIASVGAAGNVAVSGAISGTGSVTKNGTGAGALVLSSTTNSYSGGTVINQGNLTYSADGAIPAGTAVTVGNGVDTSQLNMTTAMTAGNAFGVTINANGTIAQTTNAFVTTLQGSGSITMPSAGTVVLDTTTVTDASFSGSISGGLASASTNPAAGVRFNKAGTSVLTLTGAQTFVSRTFIANGAIDAQNSAALGVAGANSAVYVRATGTTGSLYVENSIVLPKTMFLNGGGFGGNGAVRNISGTNEISGTVNIGWTGGTEAAAAAVTVQTDAGSLNFSGVLAGNTAGITLTKTGAGTLIYSGASANTFNQNTIVSGGTLQLNKTAGVNAIATNAQITGGTLQLAAANQIANTSIITINGGTFDLNGNTDTIGSLLFTTGTFTQGGAILSIANATATALTQSDGTTISGPVAYTAAGGFTYNGTTTTATFSGQLDLGTTAHPFDIADGAAAVDMDFSGTIIGTTGTLTKGTSAGVLQFSGGSANTYAGLTTVNTGTLQLNKTPGVNAIAANATVSGGTLKLAAANQIADTSTVTLSSGTFDLNGNVETIASLTFTGGTLTQGGAVLSLASNATALTMTGTTISGPIALTGSGGVTTNGSASIATISGDLDLGTQVHTFTIANGAATPDLELTGKVLGTGGLTKVTGASELRLSGASANTYSGLTTVTAGTLNMNKSANTNAIGGNVLVNGGTLLQSAAQQIIDSATVTITSGTWTMDGNNETIDNLVFSGGTLTQAGGGVLTLGSNTTLLTMQNVTIPGAVVFSGTGNVVFNGAAGSATLAGTVNMGGNVHTFDIANGSAANDMILSNVVSNGGITKIGAGRMQFTGAAATDNTYTGLTTVTVGELRLSKTAGVISIPGNVLINGGLLTNTTANQIADTASMTISSGQWDMGGSAETINDLTFTGGTLTTGGGVLTLASTGTALTMQNVTITGNTVSLTGAGSTVVFDATNNGTATFTGNVNLNTVAHTFNIANGTASTDMLISGVISGAGGSITKTGAGTLEFEGAGTNTYTGLTTVTAGQLLLTKTGVATAIAGDVLINGGTVTLGLANKIANTSTMTITSGTFDLGGFAETMSALVFNGGTLSQSNGILTLANTTTPLMMQNTTISGPIVFSGATGDIRFDATNNGTATINGTVDLGGVTRSFNIDDGTAAIDMQIGGVISNGGLTKIGAGTLVLTGANTYAAGTTVTAGTLQGNSTSLQGAITDNANLVFNQTFDGTYAGAISGTGTLVKQGSGNLVLSGANSVGGLTTVSAGRLAVDGSLAGAGTLSVLGGATLGGVGTVSKDCTISGTLAPGDSIGTINLVGAQVQATGSTLEIEFSPTTIDLVNVTGTYTIQPGATLHLVPLMGNYEAPFSQVLVNTTGGVSNRFTTVTSDLPLFAGDVIYTTLQIILPNIFNPFAHLVTKGNAAQVAHCLDVLPAPTGSDLAMVINELRMLPTVAQLMDALERMQPSAFTSVAVAQENALLSIRNVLFNRLEATAHSCLLDRTDALSFWVAPFADTSKQRNRDGEPGYTTWTPGILVGLDSAVGRHVTLGGSFGYTYNWLHWEQLRGHAICQTLNSSVYTKWGTKRGYVESALTGACNFYQTNRRIHFGTFLGIDRRATADHLGAEGSFHLKGAYLGKLSKAVVSPFAAVDYLFLYEQGFTEFGANSLDLTVERKFSDLLNSEVGIDLSHCFTKPGLSFTPYLQASAIWEQRFLGRTEKSSLRGGCFMETHGLNPSRLLGSFAAGMNLAIPGNTPFLSLYYKGKFGSSFRDHSVVLQAMINY